MKYDFKQFDADFPDDEVAHYPTCHQGILAIDYKLQRELRGTQSAVAALLGVSQVTIARRETGAQVITRGEYPLTACNGKI